MYSIIFTGDVAFSKHLHNAHQNKNFLSNDVCSFFQTADENIVNLEGCIGENTSSDTFSHSSSESTIPFFKSIHTTCWNLANNHILDYGKEGLLNTINIAKLYHISVVGAGMTGFDAKAPIILNKYIGLLSVTFPKKNEIINRSIYKNYWDDKDIEKTIKELKKDCQWCIIIVHGGDEFSPMPSPKIRKRYREYLNMGADIVVGHHPHVVQNYEKIGGKMIFYSLGNFVFDTDYQRTQRNTEIGVLLKLSFTDKHYSFEAIGTKLNRDDGRIEKCDLPVIFKAIQPISYQYYWLRAANAYRINRYVQWAYWEKNQSLGETICLFRDMNSNNPDTKELVRLSMWAEILPALTKTERYIRDSAGYSQQQSLVRISMKNRYLSIVKKCKCYVKRFIKFIIGSRGVESLKHYRKMRKFCKEYPILYKSLKVIKMQEIDNRERFTSVYDVQDYISNDSVYLRQIKPYLNTLNVKSLGKMVCSYINGGFMPEEYINFGFDPKARIDQKCYLSRRNALNIYRESDRNVLPNSKYDRYWIFKKYFYRDVILLAMDDSETDIERFVSFFNKHDECIIKPVRGCEGKGVERITLKEYPKYSDLAKYVGHRECLLEEFIKQGEELACFHKPSVNTIRFVTGMGDDGSYHELYALLRVGIGDSITDNVGSGGMAASIDIETGIIESNAIIGTTYYERHPDTQIKFMNYVIPHWNDLRQIIKEAHSILPNETLLGWDFAWSDNNKWCLIEVNPAPSFSTYQKIKGGILPLLNNNKMI